MTSLSFRFTARYRELLDHYGLRGSKNTPGRAHENGDVESAHGSFKGAVEQRLRLRGSREFESLEAYQGVSRRSSPSVTSRVGSGWPRSFP